MKVNKLIAEINDKIVEYIQQVEKEYEEDEICLSDYLEWGRSTSKEMQPKINNPKISNCK